MARLIPGRLPLPAIADTAVQGGARGRVNILSGLAGTAHWLNQYVTGTVPADNDQCAPYTGAGNGPGHDHSGGVLGRPIQHTFMCAQFGNAALNLSNTVNGEAPTSGVTNTTPAAAALGTPRLLYLGPVKTVRVPPCGPDGAYHRGDFVVSVRSTAACDLNVKVTPEVGPQLVFTSTLASGINHCVAGNNGRVSLVPGKRNTIHIELELEWTSADATVTLLSFGIHQIANSA